MAKRIVRSRHSFTLSFGPSLLITALASVWIALIPSVVHANTITVNTTGDPGLSGTCDLRDAITNANGKDQSGSANCVAGSGTDTIVFRVSGTITLSSGTLPDIVNTLTINGSGQTITLDGASTYEVLAVNSGATLNLNNLTIANGNAANGGGIFNGGTLTVANSTFSANSATSGDGGGIDNEATLIVTNSTFYDNGAPGDQGGAIFSEGTLTVTNSTFYDNSANEAGAIYNAATATVANSILADSTAGNCIGDTFTDGGYNISDDDTCDFTGTGANGKPIGDNVSDANIKLGPLANNGGPNQTLALGTGSYAIDAIPFARCLSTDQRGAPRPDPGDIFHPACDIGAFESGNLVWFAPTSLNFGTVPVGQRSAPMTVRLNNDSGQDLKIRKWSIGANYAIVATTCPPPPSILPSGDSCTFDIIFRPIYGGVRNDLFQVNDNLVGGKQTVNLHGVATSSSAPR
jgi:hypothetical protein